MIRAARRRIQENTGESEEALIDGVWETFEEEILERLAVITEKALYAEFASYRTVARQFGTENADDSGQADPLYHAFITSMAEGKLETFLERYPVAARLCAQITDFWVEATSEFIQRLAADRSALEETFNDGNPLGEVVDVETSMSDPHGGGRSVIIAAFACGKKIVYKPRSLHVEAFYATFLAWLEERGAMHPLRRLSVLERTEYGWIEFAEHQPSRSERETERFYQRCGMLLCITYVFNGADFHRGNLIACGEQPVLIDMEGLLRPHFDLEERLPTQDLVPRPAKRRFLKSVLNTRMLPMLKTASSGHAVDTSSLGSGHQSAIGVKKWANINQDDMRPHKHAVAKDGLSPHVLYREDGTPTHARNRLNEVIEGFEHTYALLREHRSELLGEDGLLSEMKGKSVRFILRNTSLYTTLIERTLHPKYLRNEVDRFIQLDVLTRPLLALDERPTIWPAVAAEREALNQMDVPFFETQTDSTALTLPSGEKVPGCFARSAYDEACERLRGLDDEERVFQTTVTREVFRINDARGLHMKNAATGEAATGEADTGEPDNESHDAQVKGEAPETEQLRAAAEREARRVAETLVERSTRGDDGSLSWVGANYLASARRHAVGPAKMNLFDGYSGTALLFAALARVTEETLFEAQALAALKPLRLRLGELEKAVGLRRSVNIGGATGLGSVVYALTRAAEMLEDPALLGDAEQVAALLDPDELDHNGAFDVVSGAAGAVLGLLALHDIGGSSRAMRYAAAWGKYLLEKRVEEPETGLRTWPSAQRRGFETGFAHGQAGIACALWRLGSKTEEARFTKAANEAATYERGVLDANSTDVLEAERTAAWSHGSTGIGLSRLSGIRATDAPEVQSDLDAALRHVQQCRSSGTDVLCCGTAGRISVLQAAAHKLGQPALLSEAQAEAMRLCKASQETGGFRLAWSQKVFDTGFFQGSAGIAYTLLRAAWPEVVPPILLRA